jgi:hypothetical protein
MAAFTNQVQVDWPPLLTRCRRLATFTNQGQEMYLSGGGGGVYSVFTVHSEFLKWNLKDITLPAYMEGQAVNGGHFLLKN